MCVSEAAHPVGVGSHVAAAFPVDSVNTEALEPIGVMSRRITCKWLAQRARQADGHSLGEDMLGLSSVLWKVNLSTGPHSQSRET